MATIRCPYCEFVIELSGVRPGKFHPRCPKCHGKFSLKVFEDASIAPQVGVEERSGSDATWTGRVTAHSPDETRVPTTTHANHKTRGASPGDTAAPPTAKAQATRPAAHAANVTAAPTAPLPTKPGASFDSVAGTQIPGAIRDLSGDSVGGRSSSVAGRSDSVAGRSGSMTGATRSGSMAGSTFPPKASRSGSLAGATVAPHGSSDSVRGATAIPSGEDAFRTIAKQPRPDEPELHGRLGGYEIVQKLGQGGMGSVYLARQLSLDRDVAIKTLAPHLAQDPSFVARFTREAYAAAQLNHHNVVHIHDIGEERGHHFFSMEFVEGQNLGHAVQSEGKLEPSTAVGYVLQAARGLKAAHDAGLIHRDVKPENMLLNGQGIVKVADLGLVKRRGDKDITSVGGPAPEDGSDGRTQFHTSMGTPAYIAPEQAMDAAHVDQRADIYSLGCTLYDLVTGRPPFSGRTAEEVITKHLHNPVPPPERLVRNLSPELSRIIQKMVEKSPEARYQTMAQVIRELERYLGVDGGNVRASSDRVKIVEYAVERFNASPAAKLRGNVIVAFFALCFAGALVCGIAGFHRWAGALVATAVLSTVAYQLTIGVLLRTPLFAKVRQFLFGASVLDWLKVIGIAIVTGWALFVFDQLWVWLGVAFVAAGIGAGFHFVFDSIVNKQREKPLADADLLIKELRVKGQDEDQIRGFIAKFGGDNWEAFYEALFGYDSKLWARALYGTGERGKRRKKHAAWRDTLIGWIDRRIEARKQARERKLLAKVEAKALAAKGVAADMAAKQAKASASRLVERVTIARETAEQRRIQETLAPTKKPTVKPKSSKAQAMLEEADAIHVGNVEAEQGLEGWEKQSYLKRRVGGPLDVAFGKTTRFALAALVLLGFGMWWNQNYGARAKADAQRLAQTTAKDATQIVAEGGNRAKELVTSATSAESTRPLAVPGVPQVLSNPVGSWSGLVAGLVLLAVVFFEGKRMTILAWAGAAFALFGAGLIATYVPALDGLKDLIARVVGGTVGFLAIFFFRRLTD